VIHPHRYLRRSRRAAALLIVLATLVLASAAAATLAAIASLSRTTRDSVEFLRQADDLLRAAEAPVRDWLATRSESAVLPPDAAEPRVEILEQRWRAAGTDFALHIAAWDQCGMVPPGYAEPGSPLLASAHERVLHAVAETNWQPIHGLDSLAHLMFRGAAASDRIRVFPGPSGDPAVGAAIATHNPPMTRDRARRRDPRAFDAIINVSTAPEPLLAGALQATGVEDDILGFILGRRRAGRPVSVMFAGSVPPEAHRLRFTSASECWAFRIDAEAGRVRRSAWLVFALESGDWVCMQRLIIGADTPAMHRRMAP
jgi:hypothetical protein